MGMCFPVSMDAKAVFQFSIHFQLTFTSLKPNPKPKMSGMPNPDATVLESCNHCRRPVALTWRTNQPANRLCPHCKQSHSFQGQVRPLLLCVDRTCMWSVQAAEAFAVQLVSSDGSPYDPRKDEEPEGLDCPSCGLCPCDGSTKHCLEPRS
jgi:hypothetical protein